MLISWSGIVRLLRRRFVLGIIFGLSLTYCAISLFAHDKIENALSTYTDDVDDNMIIDGDDLPPDDDLDDDLLSKISDPDDVNLESNNLQGFDNFNSTNTQKSCRNSIQGRVLIVDDRGFVCARKDVLPTGCCKFHIEKNKNNDELNTTMKIKNNSCDTCTSQGCCEVYEYCVSCCLYAAKGRGKKDSHVSRNRRDMQQKSLKIHDTMRQRLRKLDKFQQCLAVCRTSSASVRHENTYKNPKFKYCYTSIGYQYISGQQNKIRYVNNNNNGDNIAVTSSTVKLFILDCFNPLLSTNKTIF